MKTILTSLVTLMSLIISMTASAGSTYNITANGNWSASMPTGCSNCTINISNGVTLTIDKPITCQNCTFSGGSMVATAFSINLQYSGPVTATTFANTNLTMNTSGSFTANAPVKMTNSTFTFYGTTTLTNSYQFDMTNSRINLYGNSKMTANGGPVNLMSSSHIVIGDGSASSKSSLLINGYALNIYDNSNVAIQGTSNTYQNWGTYSTAPTTAGPLTSHSSYNSTPSSNMNCGGSYPNACSNPNLYGPSSISTAGTVQGPTTLPIILDAFAAELNSNATVGLTWTTAQESNSSHFEIERSIDGATWNTIGEEAARGNSSLPSYYTYTDVNPSAGNNYYRLKMVDLDGRAVYSGIRVIAKASVAAKVSLFPNPAHDYVNVSLGSTDASQVTVRLMNQAGQVLQVKTGTTGNGSTISFPVQQYPTGMYILVVSAADGTQQSNKVMISRS